MEHKDHYSGESSQEDRSLAKQAEVLQGPSSLKALKKLPAHLSKYDFTRLRVVRAAETKAGQPHRGVVPITTTPRGRFIRKKVWNKDEQVFNTIWKKIWMR